MRIFRTPPQLALALPLSITLAFGVLAPAHSAPLTGVTQSGSQESGNPALGAGEFAEASVNNSPTVEKDTDQIVVKFKDGISENTKKEVLTETAEETPLDEKSTEFVSETVNSAEIVKSDEELSPEEQDKVVEKLSADPAVEYAEADLRIKSAEAATLSIAPNDPLWHKQRWNMLAINAPGAWETNVGDDVVIGIADEGYSTHPELNSRTVPGFDFTNVDFSRDGDGWDYNPQDMGDWAGSRASMWHGMHVAGIAGSSSHNGLGMAGVAPRAKIQHARILGAGGDSYISDMAAGVAWSAGVYVPGAPVNNTPANVVNISASFPSATCPQVFKDAINKAHARNVPVVVAAGNNGKDAANYSPGNCLGAIVVGATAGNGYQNMVGYSNYGWYLDVVAPGGAVGTDVWSTVTDGSRGPGNPSYGPLNGTSMAAPHVAGIIALMKERDPNITVESIRALLQRTGSSVNGYKFVDAKKAVNSVIPVRTKSPFRDVSTSHPFLKDITWARNLGISTGWNDGTYRPHEPISRAAMAAFLYRMAGSPSYAPPAQSRFRDIRYGDPFYKEVSWLAAQGITTGWNDGTFHPNEPISRAAMAAFLYRMDGSPSYYAPSSSRFRDIRYGDSFYKEVSWLAAQGITTGWNDGTFRPNEPINRDAMAAFLYRYAH